MATVHRPLCCQCNLGPALHRLSAGGIACLAVP